MGTITYCSMFLYTSGGDVEAAFAIKSLIEVNKIKVTIYCSRVESAGTIILSAAKKKISFKYTFFMFHNTRLENDTKEERKKYKVKMDKLDKMCQELYQKIKFTDQHQYFGPYQLLELGYIDEVI